MAADRVITCTNQDNDSITFRETGFFPFVLVSAEGVYDNNNNVYLMENSMMDGAIYQGSNTPYRNIVITVKDISHPKSFYAGSDAFITSATLKGKHLHINDVVIPDEMEQDEDDGDAEIQITSAAIKGKSIEIYSAVKPLKSIEGKDFVDHRSMLDKVFKRNERGRLSFTEYGEERVIDYYVERVTSTGTHSSRMHTISLICPDPFFYNPNEQNYVIGEIIPTFKFVHEFSAAGEEFGYFSATYKNIYNESANDNIGVTISISGKAAITNPSLTRLESGEHIQIGTDDDPFVLDVGDMIFITTATGNKHVYFMSDGELTEINHKMADGSKFIQLMRGDNNIYFDCDTGRRTARVEVAYRMQYARA